VIGMDVSQKYSIDRRCRIARCGKVSQQMSAIVAEKLTRSGID